MGGYSSKNIDVLIIYQNHYINVIILWQLIKINLIILILIIICFYEIALVNKHAFIF